MLQGKLNDKKGTDYNFDLLQLLNQVNLISCGKIALVGSFAKGTPRSQFFARLTQLLAT